MIYRRKLTPAEQEARRAKNRDGMRKIRHRQRQELQQMKSTVIELEKQYAELCRRTKPAELAVHDEPLTNDDDPDLVVLAKQLGAEKLLLQTMLKQKAAWALQIQRVLDFETSSLAATRHFQTTANVKLDTVDEVQAADELGFIH